MKTKYIFQNMSDKIKKLTSWVRCFTWDTSTSNHNDK